MRDHSIERPWKSNRLLNANFLFASTAMLFFFGCATGTSKDGALTTEERIQRELATGAGLARQLESHLEFKQDKEVSIYLHNLASQLTVNNPALKTSSVGVRVVVDHGARWRDYSVPGNWIYLSSGLLKRLEYENEVAALIAVELAHVLSGHVPHRLQEGRVLAQASNPLDFPSIEGLVPTSSNAVLRDVDFFSPTGVFAYPDEYFIESVETAVSLLYQAGFDPRGLVSLWEFYRSERRHSPFEEDLLRKLADKTRTIIAHYSPLRNPIVRSAAFLSIQKRIQGL